MKTAFMLFMVFLVVGSPAAQEGPVKKSQEASAINPDVPPKAPGAPTYKMAISIYELQDGKRINQRDYSLLILADDRGGNKLKIGTKAPINAGNDSITYTDVGFEVECSLAETSNNKVAVRIDLGLSSFAIPEQNTDPRTASKQPVLRFVAQRVHAVLTPGKPQMVTSVDDVNSNKRMQLEVTATKVE